jgi:hypothetical protein
MRLDFASAESGTLGLTGQDVVVLSDDAAGFPAGCSQSDSGSWSGELRISEIQVDEGALARLRGFFNLFCTATENQTVGLRGCVNFDFSAEQ